MFLNVWNAKQRESLEHFLRTHRETTDLFCFQEVYPEARELLDQLLSGWTSVHGYKRLDKRDDFPQSTYAREGITLRFARTLLEEVRGAGLALYTEVVAPEGVFHVANVHGAAHPGEKRDTPSRIVQSEAVIDFLRSKDGPKIVGGDFNLLPDTRSVRLFSEHGFVDMIDAHRIPTTRNRFAWDLYPADQKLYHSDYVFVSDTVTVREFAVPAVEISDHLPLILEIA